MPWGLVGVYVIYPSSLLDVKEGCLRGGWGLALYPLDNASVVDADVYRVALGGKEGLLKPCPCPFSLAVEDFR